MARAGWWQTEEMWWVQKQAPAGNWVDVLGIPDQEPKDLKRALDIAEHGMAEGHKTRVVQKQYRVITREPS